MNNQLLTALLSLSLLLLSACDPKPPSQPPEENGQAQLSGYRLEDNKPPQGKLPSIAHPIAYRLSLTLDPREHGFSGTVEIDIELAQNTDVIWLHGKDLRVAEAVLLLADGTEVPARYEQLLDTGVAAVSFPQMVAAGEVMLRISYSADYDLNLAGLFKVEEQGESYALAKSESIQARGYMPGFDEPGMKAPYDMVLTVPTGYHVITNSPELSREPSGNGMEIVRFATTRPISTYLLSLAVGPFDVVERDALPTNEFRDNAIPLRGFARKGRGADMSYILDITPRMVEIFEQQLERPYPFAKLDIVAAPQWPSGATELSAAITYREQVILVGDDPAPGARLALLNIHAHEIAHMWLGNLVTPPWWDDLWLKEGFATWGSPLALTIMEPGQGHDVTAAASSIAAMKLDSLASTRAIREPINSNENVRNAYDAITYRKSLGVIHMVDQYFGSEVFRPALGRYVATFADGDASSPQFYEVIARETDTPALTDTFRSFVEQKGVPLLQIESDCNDGKLLMNISQDRYRPLGSPIADDAVKWSIPFCMRTDSGERHCQMLDNSQTQLALEYGSCPVWVMPNAEGAGYYRWNLPEAQWQVLLASFSQLSATEALAVVDSALANFEAGLLPAQIVWQVVAASASSEYRQVVTAPLARLSNYARQYLDGAQRRNLSAYLSGVYLPVLNSLENATTDDDQLLRSTLRGFLATTVAVPHVREQLAQQAAAFTGFKQSRVDNALSSDLYSDALTVAVQDLSPEFTTHLLQVRTELDDPKFESASATALGGLQDKSDIATVQSVLLGDDFGGREAYGLLLSATEDHASRKLYWSWIVANFEAVMQKIPAQWRRRTPMLAQHFCSEEGIAAVQTLFAEKGELAPGYQRALDQTVERIQLCVALAPQGAQLVNAMP
ncbi:MAG: M1 family aminopeptidase [Halioglobus sp.]